MPGLGPRVGGAHVDVNLKFDDKSLAKVGKKIHSDLMRIGQRNRAAYQALGRDAVTAWRAALGAIVSSAPLFGSAISGVSGAATMLAGSLQSVVKSSYAFVGVLGAVGLAGITAKIGMRNFGAAVSEVDPKQLQLYLSTMPKSMQEAVMATRRLSDEIRAAVWDKLWAGVGQGLSKFVDTGVVQRGLGQMAESINGLVRSLLRYANSKSGIEQIGTAMAGSASIFEHLSNAVTPFLDGFLRFHNALIPASTRLADRITDIAERFQAWTSGPGFAKELDGEMRRAEKTAGLLFKVLGNLGSAISNVFNAASPATNTFLEMLVGVTEKFDKWSASVSGKNSIAEWASQSVDVMRQFGSTIGAVFEVIAELADPRVIISFLRTVEEAFNYLGDLPLDSIVSGFATLAEMFQPVSSAFLAFIVTGAAVNVLIGSLMGQFGGFYSVLVKFLKFKILTNILKGMGGGAGAAGDAAGKAAGKVGFLSRMWQGLLRILARLTARLGPVGSFFARISGSTAKTAQQAGKLSSAFKPVMSILGRFAKFAGPVGMAVWIGTIIAKSDSLKAKFGDLWGALKKVGSSLTGAFAEIGEALTPLAPVAEKVGSAMGVVFGWMDKVAEVIIGFALDTLIYGFESLANVITGVGKIVAGFINTITGLIEGIRTGDWGSMLDGLKQMVSGIWPLLKGVFGLFVTFFAPAKLLKVGMGMFRGLLGGLKGAAPAVLGFLRSMITRVLKFFLTLSPRLMALGGRAIMGLGRAISARAPRVVAAAGRIAAGVIRWISRLPGRLLSLGSKAVTTLGGAISRGTGRVLSATGRIVTGVIRWVSRLPGRLATFGRDAISKLASAFTAGISTVGAIVRRIATAVIDAIKDLPGKALNIGREIVSNIASGITSSISKVTGAISKVAGAVGKFWPGSPVKEGPLRAWNYGNDASGGGRKVIEALTAGLRDTRPINQVMKGVASAVAGGVQPRDVATSHPSGPTFPNRMVLRIGNRDFVAYVEQIADTRIDAADALAYQGA